MGSGELKLFKETKWVQLGTIKVFKETNGFRGTIKVFKETKWVQGDKGS